MDIFVMVCRRWEDGSMTTAYPCNDREKAETLFNKCVDKFRSYFFKHHRNDTEYFEEEDSFEAYCNYDVDDCYVRIIEQEHVTPDKAIEQMDLNGYFD